LVDRNGDVSPGVVSVFLGLDTIAGVAVR
jgi:hypothetical protein